VGFFDLY